MKVLFWMFIGFDRHATSEHLLCAMIEQLCRAGHTVHLVQKDTGGELPAIPTRLKDYPVTTDTVPARAVDKKNFAARYLAELAYIRQCKKVFHADYDAAFIQSDNAAGFAVSAVRRKAPGARITFNVQDVFPYNAALGGKLKQNGRLFRALAAVQRYGYRHADRVITISEDMKDTLVADGSEADKTEVIYNWSYQDALYENPDLAPVAHLFRPDTFRVVYAGNIGLMQNVELLIETADRMRNDPSVFFYIIGDGVYREKLEETVKARGMENVAFLPMQPPELAPLLYSAADVNVIPLVKGAYRTALPSKTATCLACGKPVIFAIGKQSRFGARVREEAGAIVTEPDQPDELAEAIRAVQNGAKATGAGAFFLKYCGITANSKRYAELIAGKG
ncbi:MAG: glycosyltransferase family 4 protein [Oscillospiraceae bacterium]|nr:glycosyltransferase family 4 protein [Oscillospiraceae bacterium]